MKLFSFALLSSLACTALAGPVALQKDSLDIRTSSTDLGHLDDRDEANVPTWDEAKKLIADSSGFSAYTKKGKPAADTSVFFTCLSNADCIKLGKWVTAQKLTVVGQIWKNINLQSLGQYKVIGSDGKSKKVDAAEFYKFQKAFSEYYATVSSGKAYLVFPHSDTPTSGHIFYDVEMPAIIKSGKVTEIIWLDATKILAGDATYDWKTEKKVYWKKPEAQPKAGGAEAHGADEPAGTHQPAGGWTEDDDERWDEALARYKKMLPKEPGYQVDGDGNTPLKATAQILVAKKDG